LPAGQSLSVVQGLPSGEPAQEGEGTHMVSSLESRVHPDGSPPGLEEALLWQAERHAASVEAQAA